MRIAIACDHAAVDLKQLLAEHLSARGHEVADLGVTPGERADYPNQAAQVAARIQTGAAERGVLLCGTGLGMSIAANKVAGVRAVLCHDCFSAEMGRAHNDAQVLCMGARVVGPELARKVLDSFIDADFEGGRHQRRVDLITSLEER